SGDWSSDVCSSDLLREPAVEKGCAYLESGRDRRAVSLYEVVLGEVEDQVECAGDLPGGSRSERRDDIVRLDVRLRVQDLALDLRDEQAAERLGREAPHPAQVSLERGPSHLAQESAQREIDAQVAVRGRQALGGGGNRTWGCAVPSRAATAAAAARSS